MSFDPDAVSTVTFDSFSTLVDVGSATDALDGVVDDPDAVARHWRTRSLFYAMVSNHIDAYQPFYEMNRDALEHALASAGAAVSAAQRDEILAVYARLDVFDDVRPGIERLVDAGYDCYVVSNGNPEMLDRMVDHTEIGDLIGEAISADEVEVFKPASELYRHAAARTGTPIDEMAHAAAGWSDVMGARHAGMQGVWVERGSDPWEPFDGEPDLRVPTIAALADELGA
jgi:2-haloacid dehalogenase